jgi:hypothetical protein
MLGYTLFVKSRKDDNFCRIKNIISKNSDQCLSTNSEENVKSIPDIKSKIYSINDKSIEIIKSSRKPTEINHIKEKKRVGTKHTIKNRKTVKIGNKYVTTIHTNETIKFNNNTVILNNITNKTIIDEDATYYMVTYNKTILLDEIVISNDIKKDVTKKTKVKSNIVKKIPINTKYNNEMKQVINKVKIKSSAIKNKHPFLKIFLKGNSLKFVINEIRIL